jgi:CheY-like chemotaxis protein
VAAPAATRFAGRVLLIEDNDLNRHVLSMMIERAGCSVCTAADGRQGVAAFVADRFDLVLMDCRMPRLDGYGAAEKMREHEAGGPRTPIVAITAHTLPEDIRRSLDAGMDDHLNKPVLPESLTEMLARWLPPEAHASTRASA